MLRKPLLSQSSFAASSRTLSAHNQIARILGMEILAGTIPSNTTLPAEAELLNRFQISRTVLREVIKTLAAKGFVVSKARVGTTVLPSMHWNYFDADVLSWKLSLGFDEEFRKDLADIRRAFEPRAAALAAQRRSKEDIKVLRCAIAKMRAPGHTQQTYSEADLEFHIAVGVASGNVLIRSIAVVIEAALFTSFELNSPFTPFETHGLDVHAASVNKHELIVDAIESRDSDAAAATMLNVIDEGAARVEMAFKAGRPNLKASATKKKNKQSA